MKAIWTKFQSVTVNTTSIGLRKIQAQRPMLSIHFDAKVASDKEILGFVDKWNVKYAAIHLPALDTRSVLIDKLVRRNVCIYAYTSDSEDQITAYHARGVHGFYTDSYIPAYW